MEMLVRLIEVVLSLSLLMFIASTVYLVSAVKKRDPSFIRNAVRNPVFPNLNLSFFRNLRLKYLSFGKMKSIATLNKFSFYFLLLSFFTLLFLVIFQELMRY